MKVSPQEREVTLDSVETWKELVQEYQFLPAWAQTIILYWIITLIIALIAYATYHLLRLIDTSFERLLRYFSKFLRLEDMKKCANLVARVEAILGRLRGSLGVSTILVDPSSLENRSPRILHRHFGWWVAHIVLITARFISIILGLLMIMARRTLVNFLTWIAAAWESGLLKELATYVPWTPLRGWVTSVQPSQIAAVFGLLVIAAALVTKSDIRGRTEFSKTASVECRKSLQLLLPHLALLIKTQEKAAGNIDRNLKRFPSETFMKEVTGFHGVTYSGNKIVITNKCSDKCHPNLTQKSRYERQVLPRVAKDLPTNTEVGSDVEEALKESRKILRDLGDKGFSHRISSVIPWAGIQARYNLIHRPDFFYSEQLHTSGEVAESLLQEMSTEISDVRWQWRSSPESKEYNKAEKSLKRLISRCVLVIRDDAWDLILESQRLRLMYSSIVRSRKERPIDRLKQ